MEFLRIPISTCIILTVIRGGYAKDETLPKSQSPYLFNLGGLPSLGDLGSSLPLTLPSRTTLGGTSTITTTTVAPTTAPSRKKRSDETANAYLTPEDTIQKDWSPYVFNFGGLPSLGDLGSKLPFTLPSLTTLGGTPTLTTLGGTPTLTTLGGTPTLTTLGETPTLTTLGGTPTLTTITVAPTTAPSRKRRSDETVKGELSLGEESVQKDRLPYVFNLGSLPSLGDLGSSLPLTLPSLTTLGGTPTLITTTVPPTTAPSRKKRSDETRNSEISPGEDVVQNDRSPHAYNLGGLPSLGDLGSSLPLTLPSLTTLGGTPTLTTTTVPPTTAPSRKRRSDETAKGELSLGEESVQKDRLPYVFNLGSLPSLGDLGSSLPLTLPSLTTLGGTPTLTTTTVPPTTAPSRKKRSDETRNSEISPGEDVVQNERSPHAYNLGGLPSLGDLGSSLPFTLPSLTTLGGTPTLTTTTVGPTNAPSRKKRSDEGAKTNLSPEGDSVQKDRSPYVFNLGGLPSLGDLGSSLPVTLPSLTTLGGTPTLTTTTVGPTNAPSRKKRSDETANAKISPGEDSIQKDRSPYVFNLGGLPSLGDLGSSLPFTLPSLTTLGGTPTLTTTTLAPTTAPSRKKRSDEISSANLSPEDDSVQKDRSPYVFNLGGLPSLGDVGSSLPLTLPSLTTLGGTPTLTTPTVPPTTVPSRKKRSDETRNSEISPGEDVVQNDRSPHAYNLGGLPSLGDLGSSIPLTLPSLTTLSGTPTLTTTTVAPTTAPSRKKRSEERANANLSPEDDSVQKDRSPYVFNLGGLPSLGDVGSSLPLTLPSLTTLGGTPTLTTPTVPPTTAPNRKKRSDETRNSEISPGEDVVQNDRSPHAYNLGGLPSLGDLGSSLPFTLPSLTTLGGTPTLTTTTAAPTTASSRKKRSPGLFGLLPSNIVSCNYTAQPGATCRSCQEALNCFSNNIGLVQKCSGRSPHCNEGRCSKTASEECGGTTTSSSPSTTTTPVTTEAAVSTTSTAVPTTTEAAVSTTSTAVATTTEAAVSITTATEPATTEAATAATTVVEETPTTISESIPTLTSTGI